MLRRMALRLAATTMPTTMFRPPLMPPDDRTPRLARAIALLVKGAIVAVATAGLALFVAAPMLVGLSWPPGAAELVPAKQALTASSAAPAARAAAR
jgi:hypothetical protein